WILPPDLTILLRVSPEVGFERIKDRPHKIPFEDVAFLRRVAANYDHLAKARRFFVLDAARPAEIVSDEAVATIERRLGSRRPSCSRTVPRGMLCEGETHGRRRSRFPCCLDAVRGETLCRTGLESSPVSSDSPWARYDGPMGTMKRPPKNIIGDSQFLQMAGLGPGQSYLCGRPVIATRMGCTHGIRGSP